MVEHYKSVQGMKKSVTNPLKPGSLHCKPGSSSSQFFSVSINILFIVLIA